MVRDTREFEELMSRVAEVAPSSSSDPVFPASEQVK
jgi:hypothetical protein